MSMERLATNQFLPDRPVANMLEKLEVQANQRRRIFEAFIVELATRYFESFLMPSFNVEVCLDDVNFSNYLDADGRAKVIEIWSEEELLLNLMAAPSLTLQLGMRRQVVHPPFQVEKCSQLLKMCKLDLLEDMVALLQTPPSVGRNQRLCSQVNLMAAIHYYESN